MNIPQKRKNKIENEFKAGGTDYVPPARPPTSQAQERLGCVSMMEPDGCDLQREITRF